MEDKGLAASAAVFCLGQVTRSRCSRLLSNWVSADLDVLVGYYASDAPLEIGETLARELAFEGLNPTYGLNIAILRRILRREEHATTEEKSVLTDSRSEAVLD